MCSGSEACGDLREAICLPVCRAAGSAAPGKPLSWAASSSVGGDTLVVIHLAGSTMQTQSGALDVCSDHDSVPGMSQMMMDATVSRPDQTGDETWAFLGVLKPEACCSLRSRSRLLGVAGERGTAQGSRCMQTLHSLTS